MDVSAMIELFDDVTLSIAPGKTFVVTAIRQTTTKNDVMVEYRLDDKEAWFMSSWVNRVEEE